MLFNLKEKKRKKTFLDSFVGGFAPAPLPFDPLTLPSYQAGYLMNLTTDMPPGSISPLVVSGQWYDAKILSNASKVLQRGGGTIMGLVNGFKCQSINIQNAALTNSTIDILTGVTDFTVLIGFKKGVAVDQRFFFGARSVGASPNTMCLLSLNSNGTLNNGIYNAGFSNGMVSVSAINTYNDNAWHALVVTFDQTNKTITSYTEQETFFGTNAAFVPGVLTPDSTGDFGIGTFPTFPANSFYPGFIGDVIILNTVADAGLINVLLNWEKSRLGI